MTSRWRTLSESRPDGAVSTSQRDMPHFSPQNLARSTEANLSSISRNCWMHVTSSGTGVLCMSKTCVKTQLVESRDMVYSGSIA
eukprot:350500-Chlamydomonas_euryale.AAC.1